MNQVHDTLLEAFPTEIICRIFELSITTSCTGVQPKFADGYGKRPPRFSPLRLGAISKAWRNIAWSHPQLWSSIAIQLDSKVFLTSAGYEIAEGWFQRSGCLPLGIRIRHRHFSQRRQRIYHLDSPDRPTVEQQARVLILVKSYSHRWMFLDLQVSSHLLGSIDFSSKQRDPYSGSSQVSTSSSHPRVQLEGLQIHDVTDPLESHLRNPRAYQTFLSDHHGPRTLRIIDASIAHIHGTKWKDLRIFSAGTMNNGDLLTIISNAPCLESLEVMRAMGGYSSQAEMLANTVTNGSPPRTHKSLRKIKFRTGTIESLEIFRKVTMPSLIWLDLTIFVQFVLHIPPATQHHHQSTEILSCLAEFFERSQPPLLTFVLEIPDISTSHTLELLHALPSTLTNMTLRRSFTPELWKDILDSFGRPCEALGGRILFPNLRDITFEHPIYKPQLTSLCWEKIAKPLHKVLSGRKEPFFKNLERLTISYQTSPPSPISIRLTQKGVKMPSGTVARFADLIKRHGLPLHVVVKFMVGCYRYTNTVPKVVHHRSEQSSNPFYDLVTLQVDHSLPDQIF